MNDPADALAAECGVLALRELVQPHLESPVDTTLDVPLAQGLRRLLDDRLEQTFTIVEAAADLGAHRRHMVRFFTQTYGIAPHKYVFGHRIDRARRLLLAGRSPAEVAAQAGFHDQSHLPGISGGPWGRRRVCPLREAELRDVNLPERENHR